MTEAQPWFVNSYSKRGITFDRLLLWEAAVTAPSTVFKNVPRDMLHKYQYFNIPATADRSDPANPVNVLKQVAQQGDFVVLNWTLITQKWRSVSWTICCKTTMLHHSLTSYSLSIMLRSNP
eukprot:GHUV01030973.1.p1 GENE.GHUV01030973.1~~GHUV01030973.1.p1  ORF type:complete len:121 (+),score=5.37 GHUV01030973.1:148-510(+)